MALPIYFTGTVSVAAGGTVVTLTGGMWSGINAKQGDFISIDNSDGILITEVTDATHLKIPPWQGAAKTNVTYTIYQNYVGRVVGVAAAEDVGDMLEKLHVDGLPFILGEDETVPDPSYGDEGQLALKPTTGQWWVKSGGAWVVSTGLTALGYGGTSTTSLAIGFSPPPKVFTTQGSLAYNGARVRAASAANLNNWMEGVASYSGTTLTMTADKISGSGTFADWLFSIAGHPGVDGTGTGDVVGPASAVTDRIAAFNGPTGKIIKDGGKLIADLATLASPTFTGDPKAPTPAAGDNDTSIATTAFVAGTMRAIRVQKFTAPGTYTPHASMLYAIVEAQGGGGGGAGSGTTNPNGGAGGATIFGTMSVPGGGGGSGLGGGATSGSPTGVLGTQLTAFAGELGEDAVFNQVLHGGQGGGSMFGGRGKSGSLSTPGGTATPNTGSGGGGAGATFSNPATSGGGGGSAGASVRTLISGPFSAVTVTIGAAGTAGAAGTSGQAGGAGSAGIVIVTEFCSQ